MFRPKQTPARKSNLSQFGLLDIPDVDDNDELMDLSDDDMDLEAELAAIGGGGPRHRPKKPAPVAPSNLDAMIAASLKDIPSDEDVSGDEEDPDLLSELNELTNDEIPESEEPPRRTTRPAPAPPSASSAPSSENSTISLLQERISNYELAEKAAKAKGESSKARRYGRGLKTLNDLLKQARAGKSINDDDIPPAVAAPKPDAPPPSSDPPPPSSDPPILEAPVSPTPPPVPPRTTSIDTPSEPLIDLGPSDPAPKPPPPSEEPLSPERQQGLEFILKRKNDFKQAALSCKHSGDKTMALEYLKVVKQFDIVVEAYKSGQEMDLSELPTVEQIAAAYKSQTVEETNQKSSEPSPALPTDEAGLITASSVDEALKQRLAYFQQVESKAKVEGNSSKARRMGRIVKEYQDAIKLNAAGRPIARDELPTPPGYAPLPDTSPAPAPAPRPAPRPAPSPAPAPARPSSRHDKQLTYLLLRQKQFKEAAIKAKKDGDIEKAKEYLRAAKGFDSVIEAARGGLVVDLKSLPLPPKAQADIEKTFDVVSEEDCDPGPSAITPSDDDVMTRLRQQLNSQLKLCQTNYEHNTALGNIAEANRFQHMAVAVKQDLDLVVVANSTGKTPKFHFETRNFTVVQCNTDLNENDLELTIVRGIAYNVPNPKEIDTYVRFEFGYPQDAPVSDRTPTVKDTNSPTYNAVFSLPIQRSNRACQRYFKRHGVKLELYSKGGWFRSDSMLGVVNVKLAPLETQVTLHESFPLMDGRRPAGGSLEVKLRVRTPLLQQQVEHTSHRWLVIDN